jgi:serine/threonine protein kinase
MILGDGAPERKAVEDFHREASVLAQLSHPSIPQIIDYFGERGRHYLVMEYVAGGDLQHRLDTIGAGARMSESNVLAMARQLLDVLQFLHSQKPPIVYRDLKPANVMIDHHGRAMLVDFGIARFLPAGGRGTQIGSVGYAPPEQYLGNMEPRSDLYALAATMHHLLTGRDPQLQPPFSFPPLSELAPGVSAQTAHVVMAALDKDLSHRPASALAMRDLLPQPASDGSGLGVPSASTGGKVRSTNVATVVLDRPVVSSRSRTPRSLAQTPVGPAPIASHKPVSISSPQVAAGVAGEGKVPQAAPLSKSAARIGAQPQLHPPAARDSLSVSSTSKTADLGSKQARSLRPDANRNLSGEPIKARSRVASALASVRAAMAAPPTTAVSADKIPDSGGPAGTVHSRVGAAQPSASPAHIVRSLNGRRDYSQLTPDCNGARLVSVADGLQFGVIGSRLVLGRASAKGDGVDIDLSNLRRGAERISRRHAEIIRQGNDYFVRDLGSVNGTYIAGRGRLGRDQLCKLKDRDELVLGGAKLEFRRG